MYTVYVLRSGKDGKRYIGMTENVLRRLAEHERGIVKSTKHRRPLQLVHIEKFGTKEAVALREKFFKSGQGRAFLKNLEKGA